MERLDGPVDLLVKAVLDGSSVDWDSAESSASSDDQRAQIRHFRTLATIAVPGGAGLISAIPLTPTPR